MKTKEIPKVKNHQISFPWRLYFQQLFATDIYVRFINPLRFWRRYKIDLLEGCHQFNTVRYLENCSQDKQQPNQKTDAVNDELQGEKRQTAIIFIPLPDLQLKYRGVAYHTNKIIAIDLDRQTIKPDSLAKDTLEQFTILENNSSTSCDRYNY